MMAFKVSSCVVFLERGEQDGRIGGWKVMFYVRPPIPLPFHPVILEVSFAGSEHIRYSM
jgi:hypothetical protein